VFVAVYVAVAVLVGVLVALGVNVFVFGINVLLAVSEVEVGRFVLVGVGELVIGISVSVRVGVRVNVGAETISENATTVSATTVLMLATKKSTTPTAGVPAWAAWLMSFTPTAAAPHNKLTPRRAAKTIHKSGRYSLGFTTKVSTSGTLSPNLMCLSSLMGTPCRQVVSDSMGTMRDTETDYWHPNGLV
jgi:hypothetical protein